MAETHLINIIANFRDNASKTFAKFNDEMKKGLPLLEDQRKKIDDLNTAHAENVKRIKQEKEVLADNIKQREKYRKMVADQVKFEKELADQKRKLIKTEKDYDHALSNQAKKLEDHISLNTKVAGTIGAVRSALAKQRVELEKNDSAMSKFARSAREFDKDGDKLTRTLQKLFYRIRGLAVGSVIIFMNSLISSLVALGGSAVAAAGSLGLAATTLVGVLIPAIAQAIPAVGLLAAAFQRLSVIQQALQAQQSINQQNARTDTSQDEARREAANQLADARRGVADAERGVADAQRQVADAQQGVKDAQDELNDSREQATRDLEDMILAEKDAQLAAQGANLSLKEAKNQLEDLIQEGASPDEVARGQLAVKEAKQDTLKTELDLQRATEDSNKAQKEGVEGSDEVVQARQALADANESVADAERGVADANRQVADSTRDLAEAQKEGANAAQAQSAAQSNLKFFLDQLSPAERDLFDQITKLKERFKQEFRPITDIIIESFGRGLRRASELLFSPEILAGLKKLAGGIADAFDDITKVFTNDEFTKFWKLMLSEGEKNLGPLTDILINLGKVFIRIAKGAAPVLSKLLKLIADETERWADSSKDTDGITEFFERGLKHIRAWYGLLKAVIGLFGELAGASSHSALETIGSLTDTVNDASESIRDNFKDVKQFFDDSAEATSALGDVIVAIGDAAIRIFGDGSTVKAFATILTDIVIPAMASAIHFTGLLIQGLGWLLDTFGFLKPILQFAIALGVAYNSLKLMYAIIVGPFVNALGFLAGLFLEIKAAIVAMNVSLALAGTSLAAVAATVALFAAAIVGVIAFAEFFDKIKEAVQSITKPISNTFNDIVSFIRKKFGIIGEFFTDFVKSMIAPFKFLVDIISGTLEGIVHIVHGIVHGDIGEVWDGLKQVLFAPFKALIDFLDTLTQPIEDAATAIFDVFVGVFKGLGDILGDIFFFAFDKVLGAVSTLIDGVVGAMQAIPDIVSPPGFQTLADNLDNVGNDIDEFREGLGRSSEDQDKLTEAQKKNLNAAADQNEVYDNLHLTQRRYTGSVDDGTKATDKNTESSKKNQRQNKDNKDQLDENTKGQKDLKDGTKDTSKELDNQRERSKDLARQLIKLAGNFVGTGNTSRDMGDLIGKVTNEILGGFGADKIKFNLPPRKDFSGATSNGTLSGGGFAQGGWIGKPGEVGPDDRWINVAGGEVAIANQHQQRPIEMALSYGKAAGVVPYGSLGELFNKEKRPHYMPGYSQGGYAQGGIVPIPGFPGESIDARILPDVLRLVKAYKLFISDGYSTDPVHAASGEHPLGLATDIVPGPGGSWDLVTQLAHWAEPTQDQPIPPFRWVGYDGDAGHGEGNHLHLSWAHGPGNPAEWVDTIKGKITGGGGIGGIMAEKLKKLKIKGPDGNLKDMLKGQAKRLIGAGNKIIAKKSSRAGLSEAGFTSVDAGGSVVRQMGQILLANGFSPAGAAGIIGNAYAESTWNPGAVGTGGGGLFGFTTSPVSLADLQDFAAQRKVPWTSVPLQMEMMLVNPHAGGSGGLMSDSYYTSTEAQLKNSTDPASAANIFMTDWERPGIPALDRRIQGAQSAFQTLQGLSAGGKRARGKKASQGGMFPSFDEGGFVPGPIGSKQFIMAHGGELVLPTHKFAKGGFAGGGVTSSPWYGAGSSPTQPTRQLNDPFPDPQQEIADIFKSISKVFKDVEGLDGFLKGIEDIIRDGGMLDDIGALLEEYTTQLARKLTEWQLEIVKIGKGKNGEEIVANIRTTVEVANRTLDNLIKIGDTMSDELAIVDHLIKQAERKLKKTDKKGEREKLIATINDLTAKQEALLDALASNMQERLDAQQAVLDARLSRFSDKRTRLDTQASIIAARSELKGTSGTNANIQNLQDVSNVLGDERGEIRKQLRQAKKSGDTEQERALKQALKENTLATLENSVAMKDVILQGFQDSLDKLDQQLTTIDLRSQIVEALSTLTGNVDYAQGSSLIQQQQALLQQQAAVLQAQLAKVTAGGDENAIAEVNNAILENTLSQIAAAQALKDLKFAVLDKLIDRLSSAFNTLDIRKQIIDATTALTGGDIDAKGITQLILLQRQNLEQQRALLQAQLAKAIASGDQELIAQYQEALATNELALIGNTQALKDLNLAVLQEKLDHLAAVMSQLDIRRQISEALTNLAGSDTDAALIKTLIEQQKTALEQQRVILEQQLAKAKATGDTKLIESTTAALLQNSLDLIGIAQALKDLEIQKFTEAMAHLTAIASQFDIRRQILELQAELSGVSTLAEQLALVQQTINNLSSQRVLLEQQLAEATAAGDTKRIEELQQALLENELATLQNTKTLQELEGTLGKVISFNSTAWTLWRHAIFNGMGGIMPSMPIPSLATGAEITQSGMANLHKGEVVVPAQVNRNIKETIGPSGDTIIQITEPMEVADPVALSNAIGMKMKTNRSINR